MRRRTMIAGTLAAAGLTTASIPLAARAGTGAEGGGGAETAGGSPGETSGRVRGYHDGLHRRTLWARGEPGIRIHVREVRRQGRDGRENGAGRPVILLVHGARPDGVAAFDLPVPGGSLAGDLAARGFAVYLMDVRGFGRSTYPPPMHTEPVQGMPLVRSAEAVRDVAAAVDLVKRRNPRRELAGFGWATGAHWLGMYAASRPDGLDHLVMLNTLYSGDSPWSLQDEMADPQDPTRPAPQPSWRAVTAESLTGRWDEETGEDPDRRRDPELRRAYQRFAVAVDPTSESRQPPSFRNPTGTLVDAFYLAQGRQFYDASLIRARTLVLRGERDFWSRTQDAERLVDHLTEAKAVRGVAIPGATHYLHLERPRFGRDQLLREIDGFLPG